MVIFTQIFTIIRYQKNFLNLFVYFTFRTGKTYYPQVVWEECKYVVKEKKMPEYNTDNIETSPSDSDREESNEENWDEENFDEEN